MIHVLCDITVSRDYYFWTFQRNIFPPFQLLNGPRISTVKTLNSLKIKKPVFFWMSGNTNPQTERHFSVILILIYWVPIAIWVQCDSFGTRPKKMWIPQRLFVRFWTCIYDCISCFMRSMSILVCRSLTSWRHQDNGWRLAPCRAKQCHCVVR